ncbi:tetratricopeptide repeat protein [Alteromonas ponticola]|uniref:Tetratricopeptide repeat protein n=1 Tax=Alteromonas ponticola TaxID=2720613 RepID=A0ABX1R385_9ALTE|nr:hypothetical protein [Alteromonas ponticola]NMH60902.1 hypothetical protein [Alteromonas ponticola]
MSTSTLFSQLKFIFCAVILCFSTMSVSASEQLKYEQERSRILRLSYYESFEALQNSSIFDSSTPLGRYFINSITTVSHRAEDAVELDETDLISLKSNYPEIELEYRVRQIIYNENTIAEKVRQLEYYARQAESNGWERIYLYAMGIIVDLELGNGFAVSALIRLLEIVDNAPLYEYAEISFDYPLQSVYNDLASAFNQLKQHERSITYCKMYEDSLPKNYHDIHTVAHCMVWPLSALGRYNEALQLLLKSVQLAKQDNDIWGISKSYLYSSEVALEMRQFDLAEEFVREAIKVQQDNHYAGMEGYAYDYLLLARIKIKKNEIAEAKKYLRFSREEQSLGKLSNYLNYDFILSEARIAESEGDHEKSVSLYKKAINLIADTHQSIPWETISDLTSKLSKKRITNQISSSEFLIGESRTTLIAGIILLVTSIIIWLIYLNVYRRNQDTYISQQVDTTTGAYNMLAFYQRAKGVPAMYSNSYVLLIELKLRNDLSLFENLLSSFAKQIRYQLKPTESIGRFSGTVLALILEGDDTDKVHDRITKIQGTLIASDFVFRTSPVQRLNKSKVKRTIDACSDNLKTRLFLGEIKA